MRNALKVLFVVALAIPTMASAVITGSKHDLSSGGAGPIKTGAAVASCNFCHLVHNAATQPALWSRSTPTDTAGYGAGNVTVAGTPLPLSRNAATQMCMSCHDGSVAMNQVAKKGGTTSLIGTFGTATGVDTATGRLTAASNAYLGAGLTGQHPVQIPYAGTTGSLATTAMGYQAATTAGCTVAGTTCVGGTTGGPDIKLFGTAAAATLECASCHEPHGVGTNAFFLRVASSANYCIACHIK